MLKKLSSSDFINRAINIHGNKYDYSKTEYIGDKIKVIIFCNKHNIEFSQLPGKHLLGQASCKECRLYKRRKGAKPSNINDFIIKAAAIHNNKYNYSQSIYINSHTKIS